jgi:hypothetical protein
VHTTKYPSGEIRGQIGNGRGGSNHGDHDHQH